MKIIYSEKAPDPIGPYSQAVLVNGLLYVSGQVAIDSKNQDLITGSIEAESHQM
jgi:2-iminobutanoate/2-iminopropanoate deaminase